MSMKRPDETQGEFTLRLAREEWQGIALRSVLEKIRAGMPAEEAIAQVADELGVKS